MNGVRMAFHSRVPRYHRIAEALRERIRVGELPSGARLDNQRQLAKSFGVTLMTLRQALELLEREHLITRRHGLGTFVAAPSIDYDILQLRRFAGDLSAKGEHVATRLLGTRFAAPDRRVAEALRLSGRPRVLVLERLRLVDAHPMGLQRSFLPSPLGDEVIRADLALTPLHQVLAAAHSSESFKDTIVTFFQAGGRFMYVNVFWMSCAVAVIIENAGQGGVDAAPLGGQVMRAVLGK